MEKKIVTAGELNTLVSNSGVETRHYNEFSNENLCPTILEIRNRFTYPGVLKIYDIYASNELLRLGDLEIITDSNYNCIFLAREAGIYTLLEVTTNGYNSEYYTGTVPSSSEALINIPEGGTVKHTQGRLCILNKDGIEVYPEVGSNFPLIYAKKDGQVNYLVDKGIDPYVPEIWYGNIFLIRNQVETTPYLLLFSKYPYLLFSPTSYNSTKTLTREMLSYILETVKIRDGIALGDNAFTVLWKDKNLIRADNGYTLDNINAYNTLDRIYVYGLTSNAVGTTLVLDGYSNYTAVSVIYKASNVI